MSDDKKGVQWASPSSLQQRGAYSPVGGEDEQPLNHSGGGHSGGALVGEEGDDTLSPIETRRSSSFTGRPTTHSLASTRNWWSFWLLGVFNNFSYVVILAGAHSLCRCAPPLPATAAGADSDCWSFLRTLPTRTS